jgi:CheY-like chemotaxis protein
MSPEIDPLNTYQMCGQECAEIYHVETAKDWQGNDEDVADFAAQAPMDRPVLVVDDTPENRDFLRTVLSAEGYAVETATDGRDALLRLRKHAPAVIVLDLDMPVMDGRSFCYQLSRLRARFSHIPVILWSGSERLDTIAAEVHAFAAYPKLLFDFPALLDTIAEAYHVGCVASVRCAA